MLTLFYDVRERELDQEQEVFDEEQWTICEGSRICIVKQPWHTVVFVLNIFLPGFGTMLSAATCIHFRNHEGLVDGERVRCSGSVVADGLLQLFLFPILVGWVWSVIVGYQIYTQSCDAHARYEEHGRNWEKYGAK